MIDYRVREYKGLSGEPDIAMMGRAVRPQPGEN